MKRLLRWLGIGLGAVLGLIVIALGAIYVLSQHKLNKRYPLPQTAIEATSFGTTIAVCGSG